MNYGESSDKTTLEHFLRERLKELKCLYGISSLVDRYGSSLEAILQEVVGLIAQSWQYPEVTCVRIEFEGRCYKTHNFTATHWVQSAEIRVSGEKIGVIEIFYRKECPAADEGPFLKEERWLLNAVAERVGRIAERIKALEQLEVEKTALSNMNIALREVLGKVQDEKKSVAESIHTNVDKIIMPIIYALEKDVHPEQRIYLDMLKRNLQDITSPLTDNLLKENPRLSSAEAQICSMVKNGLSTKEIAELRHISPSTVSRHRENIRRKLHISNKPVNLETYLNTRMKKLTDAEEEGREEKP